MLRLMRRMMGRVKVGVKMEVKMAKIMPGGTITMMRKAIS